MKVDFKETVSLKLSSQPCDKKILVDLSKIEDEGNANKPNKQMKTIWRKEINQDYDLFLASLRANEDFAALMEVKNNIIRELHQQQVLNVELRKDIRGLERELYILRKQDAHKSCIIDSLHDVDHRIKISNAFNKETQHCLALERNERIVNEEIIASLRNEITLLKSKTEADFHLIETLKPHKSKMKGIFDSMELDIHQEAENFKQELHMILGRFKEFHSHFDSLLHKTYEKRGWIAQAYAEMNQEKLEEHNQSDPDANGKADKLAEDKVEEQLKLASQMQLLKEENAVIANLISTNFSRIASLISEIIEEILWLYEIKCDQSLIKEYIERLHVVRKKQEERHNGHNNCNARLIDELKLKLNIICEEKSLISRILNHYLNSLDGNFQMARVFVNTCANLFGKEIQAGMN